MLSSLASLSRKPRHWGLPRRCWGSPVLASDALEKRQAMPSLRGALPSLNPVSPGKYFILKLLS